MLKRILIITSISIFGLLLIIGIVFVMAMYNDDVANKSSQMYYTEKEVLDEYEGILVDVKNVDVTVLASEDRSTIIKANLYEDFSLETSVKDGILKISVKDNRSLFDRNGVQIYTNTIVIYLDEDELTTGTFKNTSGNYAIDSSLFFEELSITSESGDVLLGAEIAGKTTIKTTSGNVELAGVETQGLSIKTTSGDISITNTYITYDLEVKSNSGNVTLEVVSVQAVEIKTTSGNVFGEVTTKLTYTVKTNSGEVSCPVGEGDGTCDIETTSGNVFFHYIGS